MKKLLLLALLPCFCSLARGQTLEPSVVASSGSHFAGTNAQVTWTVGESAIETYSNSTVMLTQGFNQPRLVIIAIDDPKPELQVEVFPVPFSNELNVRIGESGQKMQVTLFDLQAKLVKPSQLLSGNATHTIDVSDISAGIYFLKVQASDGSIVKSFKIQKIR